jgi:hypothetical protein
LENIIKIYYSFKDINNLVKSYYLFNKENSTSVLDKINNQLLLMINIIQADTNLYYIFNLCFNFYNNTEGKKEKYLRKLNNINRESLKLLNNYDYLIIQIIIVNDFNSKAMAMQNIMNSIKFPLYFPCRRQGQASRSEDCAIIYTRYWCRISIQHMKYSLYNVVSNSFREKILNLSSYNNEIIALIEYKLLKGLTLHKMNKEIDSNLVIDNNGIAFINNKININYNLRKLIVNYNQIYAMITGRIMAAKPP